LSLDWRGYYQALGLSPGAADDDIKNAWRHLARQWHPDRNPGKDTTARFQQISEAYDILRDADKRRDYDAEGIRRQQIIRSATTAPSTSASPMPLVAVHVCSACQCLSAQLRVVRFYKVYGLIIKTMLKRQTAILCPRCALRRGFVTNMYNWVLGWWAFPSGPFRVLESGFINMRGGQLLRSETVSLLVQQAQAFAQTGQLKLAQGLLQSALDMSPDRAHYQQVVKIRSQLFGDIAPARLKNQWRFFGQALYMIQLVIQILLCLIFVGGLLVLGHILGLWRGMNQFWHFF